LNIEHQWLKAHICVGVKTNIVVAVTITDGTAGDSPQFEPLITQTSEGFRINEISADMAYSSRENLNFVNTIGGTPYIPFKKAQLINREVLPRGQKCIIISSLTEMNF